MGRVGPRSIEWFYSTDLAWDWVSGWRRYTHVDERPGDDPRRPEERRDDPGGGDHQDGAVRRATDAVLQRSCDAHVAVEADQQQVGNGRVADGVVERQPSVAHHRPCTPPPSASPRSTTIQINDDMTQSFITFRVRRSRGEMYIGHGHDSPRRFCVCASHVWHGIQLRHHFASCARSDHWLTQNFILGYKFNSDYIFTRLRACHTFCPVPLRYTMHGNSAGINPLYSLCCTPLGVTGRKRTLCQLNREPVSDELYSLLYSAHLLPVLRTRTSKYRSFIHHGLTHYQPKSK